MAKENEQKHGQQPEEGETKFSQQQYDLLKSCSDKKDVTEWNEWREKHPDEEIWLQGAHLENTYLRGAHLENARLMGAHLENTCLREAHLENAYLVGAYLANASLMEAHLENTSLMGGHLKNAKLIRTHLKNAKLFGAYLEHAKLSYTNLKNSELMGANLQGVRFWDAKLQCADFSRAIVDGETLFSEDCKVDRNTKFEAVALGNLRIYPKIKQLLEYNIRRKNWEEWYKGKSKNKWIIKMHQLLTYPVRLFWWISNYGLSTWRIIFTFFALAFVFALAYWLWPNFVAFNGKPAMESFQGLWHAFYFSVVTMTTLGFGDIAANPESWKGQGLLMLQVILGYVLLGALVTRFAVLFTAGGPAGKFSPIKTKEKAVDKKNKT
jgi:hypothetical protein